MLKNLAFCVIDTIDYFPIFSLFSLFPHQKMRCPLFPQLLWPSRRPGGARKAPQTMQLQSENSSQWGSSQIVDEKRLETTNQCNQGCLSKLEYFKLDKSHLPNAQAPKPGRRAAGRQGIAHRNHSGMALERNSRDGAIGYQ